MAAFDRIQNMNDIAFKPRLLRSLVREHLPDEKHPLKSPLELSHVVSMVKMHSLLSESVNANSSNPIARDSWKAAVDAWVSRVCALASSDMPDKCWAGTCLLGLTCQECSSERFLASYPEWLQKLHLHIQPSVDSHFLKVASCASLSDIFSRLGRLPKVKKDANAQAAKFVLPVLKMLNEDSSEAVWEEAVCLLCTLITFFPSSVQRSYDNVEAAVVSKIMSGKCSDKFMKELGHCLALLPKSRGDEESWSLMMHKILYALNSHLNDAFQGVEEESRSDEALKLLVPPGKDPPPPLGGCMIEGASDQKTKKPERLHISSVSALMHCCCTMLTNTYPVQVRVPIRSLVALVGRVLVVDGSSSQALFPFMTSMHQELICSELPILHLHSLELFRAVIKSVRSQLLPHAAEIVRLLTEYFRRCLLPHLRIEVYAIIKILLMSMGVGIAGYLSQEVIKNTFVDLDLDEGYMGVGGSNSNEYAKVSNEPLQPCQKKRKRHGKTKASFVEQSDQEVGLPKIPKPLSLKIAALEALESLLTIGGALGADSWRPGVDRLLITVATNACKEGWAQEYNNHVNTPVPTKTDFQLASLKSLLASLLSPARYRPPYLAQGQDLFCRGTRETGTKLSEFCGHAQQALEVLKHPRALPLIDYASFPSATSSDAVHNRFPDVSSYSDRQNHTTPFSYGKEAQNPSIIEEDDLYKSWLAEGDGMEEIQDIQNDYGKVLENDKRLPSPENVISVLNSSSLNNNTEVIEGKGDESIVEAQELKEPIKGSTTHPIGNMENKTTTNKTKSEHTNVAGITSSLGSLVDVTKRALDRTVEVDSDSESLPDIVVDDEDSESD